MASFAEKSFKSTRRAYCTYQGLDLRPGQHVIVQANRGEDLDKVSAIGVLAKRKYSSSRSKESVAGVDIWHDSVTLRDAHGASHTVSLDHLKQEVGTPQGRRQKPERTRR